ncbi:MAG TPA: CRTAC1 family protein [Gemmataceae bacterium]|nr:CRTAC1 family protein [Gemmataceae bacterium]
MNKRIVLSCLAAVGTIAGAAYFLTRGPAVGPTTVTTPDAPSGQTAGVPWFVDVTEKSGVKYVNFDSVTDKHTILETMGPGIGWIDYDNDGWMDLFCVQNGPIPSLPQTGAPTHKLYRNNGDGSFTDVTDRVGLNQAVYGQACAVGDYDNDGYDDLVVASFGVTTLYHNEADPAAPGGRRFKDVSKGAKIDNPHWGSSCAWGDIDGDGFLDLYVCNYCEIDLANYKTCENPNTRVRHICPPSIFPKVAHKLYKNNGNGTFTDVTIPSGLAGPTPGGGLAVVILDLDGDGKQDIYAVNDLGPAFLLHNQGGGKFTERGMISGAGVDPNGRFMAGMGIGVGDIDGTGRPSFLVTNYQDEPNMVFLNKGGMRFTEWSHPSGFGPATYKRLAFGIDLLDADLDGHLDVAVANGHVYRNAKEIYGYSQEQEGQLFLGDGKGRFREVSDKAGSYFREKLIGRGLAVCDFDNDGRPDLAFSHNAGPLKLLRNATENGNRSLRLELVGDGKKSNRNAVGAKIEIDAGGRKLVRWIHGGGSYLSASDRRQCVGLGTAAKADVVTVTWPSGAKQEFRDVEAGKPWRLTEGKPQPELVTPRKPG